MIEAGFRALGLNWRYLTIHVPAVRLRDAIAALLTLEMRVANLTIPHKVAVMEYLDEIAPGCPIALLSLGATRRMTIRATGPPRRVLHVDLAPGSLLVMSYETQRHYTHGIPKTREPVGGRISLAFRVRPVADAAGWATPSR